ncbi:MAG: hypothetical protein GYA21_03375 [Myxococcales bacterium]|nr:hypothetical protein [Myxococcales bacterium]
MHNILRAICSLWVAAYFGACAAPQTVPDSAPDGTQGAAPASAPVSDTAAAATATGPAFKLSVGPSVMANVLYLAEEASGWRPGSSRAYRAAFEDRFGLDDTDRELLKKYALIRAEIATRARKEAPEPSFEDPFGPEGRFPLARPDLADRYAAAVLASPEPAALGRSLAGIVEPQDAEVIATLLSRLAPRVGQLLIPVQNFASEIARIQASLDAAPVQQLLRAFMTFVHIRQGSLTLNVHPVWAPPESPFEAMLIGDRVLVTVPEGKAAGLQQAALSVHEAGRWLLSRLPPSLKSVATTRFAEKAGFRGEPFAFVEGLLDALSHGLAAPLMAAGPGEVPPWPGDAARKRLAEALTPPLREALAAQRDLNGEFALRAGELERQANPPRPADYVTGSMVIGEEDAVSLFKSQVARWTVWKFPPSRKYDYPKKLLDFPGRSVLLLLTPAEVKALPDRFAGVPGLPKALERSATLLTRKAGVILAVPRQERGYFFIVSAHSPEAFKQTAKRFFALEAIPAEPVLVD